MIKSLVVIGVGSFGGFFCKNISSLPSLKLLTIIDPDVVEFKNINNSIYRFIDVGKNKVDALEEIIKFSNPNIDIIKCNLKYKEGNIKLPFSDFVIDCRDEITKRKKDIDIRFYISFRSLIVDCRKFCDNKERRGQYIDSITSIDIENAAFHASRLFCNGSIFKLVKDRKIHYIDLDIVDISVNKELQLQKQPKNKKEVCVQQVQKLPNLVDNLHRISKQRTKSKIPVYVGTKQYPYSTHFLDSTENLNHSSTLKLFKNIVNNVPLVYENYIIRYVDDKKQPYIELLPETGGA